MSYALRKAALFVPIAALAISSCANAAELNLTLSRSLPKLSLPSTARISDTQLLSSQILSSPLSSSQISQISRIISLSHSVIDSNLAQDNVSAQFEYWPKKSNTAYEYAALDGKKYRVKKGYFSPVVSAGVFTASGKSVATQPGGLIVGFEMDHIIANADDANATITLYFGPAGGLMASGVSVSPSKGFLSTKYIIKGAALVGGIVASAFFGDEAGEAVNQVGKVLTSIVDDVGQHLNSDANMAKFNTEITNSSQLIINAVQTAAKGQRLQHTGHSIQAWEGNNCSQDEDGFIDATTVNYNLTSSGPFPNDEVRSLRLYNNIPKGSSIRIFDNSSSNTSKDDWAEIHVTDPSSFSAVGECIATFQANQNLPGLTVAYHKVKSGDLDGKVSYISIVAPRLLTLLGR